MSEGSSAEFGDAGAPAVSSSNWWNVSEIAPTQRVSRGAGETRPLPSRPRSLDAVPVKRADGTTGSVREVLDSTFTDAFAVAHKGDLISEWYAEEGGPDRLHAVLSVTKAVVGCVAGVLLDRGVLEDRREVAHYLPELDSSGYAEATVRDLLDMRSGVSFREDYTDPAADIRRMNDWLRGPRGIYEFLATLEAGRPHGGSFLYRSSETDVLGWVCERATGSPMASLMSELLWAPMGAEHDAEILCDNVGTAIHDGGFGATARDLLRFGLLLSEGGAVALPGGGTHQVVPARFLRHAWAVDADIRRAFLGSPAELAFPGGWYRSQFWFRVGPFGDVLLGLGIHGQLVYVSRRTHTVCVKLSSWPDAQNPTFMLDTLRACDAVSGALTGRDPVDDVHRLRGVVSGH
jgi:CubicO group peptidase (beta-lactamase class C family)